MEETSRKCMKEYRIAFVICFPIFYAYFSTKTIKK